MANTRLMTIDNTLVIEDEVEHSSSQQIQNVENTLLDYLKHNLEKNFNLLLEKQTQNYAMVSHKDHQIFHTNVTTSRIKKSSTFEQGLKVMLDKETCR